VTRDFTAETYIPVDAVTMHIFVWPDGAMAFSWDLSGMYGLFYEAVIRSLDGSEEYYTSGRILDTTDVYPVLRSACSGAGRKYQWFVRSWVP